MRGVPWFADVVEDAVLSKNAPGLRYALQHHRPIPKDILTSAIATESRPIVEILVKTAHVRPWGEHMHACAELGYVDIARFLCAWMGKDWKRMAREERDALRRERDALLADAKLVTSSVLIPNRNCTVQE